MRGRIEFIMIYHFILNPKSGRSGKEKNLDEMIKAACKKRQLSYHIYYTTCPGDATEYVSSMVRISQERQRFICVGGDGTLSEIVNSAPSNPNVEFGVIPRGSGNDFVRNFSNHRNFLDIDSQIDGDAIPLDLIKCNEYYSVNMINIGFDCAVVKETQRLKKHKWLPKKLLYLTGVLRTLFRRFGTKMRIIFDNGDIIDKNMTLTAIGNGKYCGGGFMASPRALLTDGILDVCAINKVSRMTFLSLLLAYKKGTFIKNKRAKRVIDYRREQHLRMEFEAPIPICIDGEIKGAKNVELSVIKNGFNFVVPNGCSILHGKGKRKRNIADSAEA